MGGGFDSPPKRRDRKYSRIRASALQDLISAKTAQQIWLDIEEYGDGYVIPLSLANLIADSDGTIKNLGLIQKTSHTPANNAEPTITIPAGELWRIHGIYAGWANSAAVADRVITVRLTNPLGVTLANSGTLSITSGVTLSASQDGFIWIYSTAHTNLTLCDNGSHTNNASVQFNTAILEAGATIYLNVTNADTDDRGSITVYYEKVGSV